MKTKSTIVLTLILVSTIAMPSMAAAYDKPLVDVDEIQQGGLGAFSMQNVFGGFGSALGGYGPGGQVLGQVFMMLFTDVYENLNMSQKMPGVWVFNATTKKTYNTTIQLSGDSTHYLPKDYNVSGVNSTDNVYCKVTKDGSAKLTYERGAGVTLIIWDNDRSFVDLLWKMITFVKSFSFDMETLSRQQISQGIQLISYFFIHINEIFTGDELFVLNPITWQKMSIDPNPSISITKEWKTSGGLNLTQPQISEITTIAQQRDDPYVKYLTSGNITIDKTQTWTEFTFDLFQLWVKTFHINIDLGVVGNMLSNLGGGGGTPSMGELFKGLDIEFFLFSHHLTGVFLYNDTNEDNNLSVEYSNVTDSNGDPIKVNGTYVQVPTTSEVTHRLYLQNASLYKYLAPEVAADGKSISWGFNITEVSVAPIPVGIGIDTYNQSESYTLDNIYLGFTFEPNVHSDRYVNAPVKLDQHFGEWDSTLPGNLDLAVIYISTALRFKLAADIDPVQGNYLDSAKNDFKDGNETLSIGDYIGGPFQDKLEFVNITGPGYYLNGTHYNANTSIIPLGLWEGEMNRRDTFQDSSGTSSQAYASEIAVQVDFNVMAYAVCYPEFNSSGQAIIHDPTFNVFMVFPPEEGILAIIILSALIAPFGVATVIITMLKRRKMMY